VSVSYDTFIDAFLGKIHSYDLFEMADEDARDETLDDYARTACRQFDKICLYDLVTTAPDSARELAADIPAGDLSEIADIVSEGMVALWMKPYLNRQELLENLLNTRDFTTYAPGELLYRVGNAYKAAESNFIRRMREYSYDHGDLTVLHL
jgi:hypothetical protein